VIKQAGWGGCGVSMLGDTQNTTRHGPGQPAVAKGGTGGSPEVPSSLSHSGIL